MAQNKSNNHSVDQSTSRPIGRSIGRSTNHSIDRFTGINRCLYILVLVIRLLSVFSPGYIHPDEQIQSLQVLADDESSVAITRPWEFCGKFPIRSALPLKILFGPAFLIARCMFSSCSLAKIPDCLFCRLSVLQFPCSALCLLSLLCCSSVLLFFCSTAGSSAAFCSSCWFGTIAV